MAKFFLNVADQLAFLYMSFYLNFLFFKVFLSVGKLYSLIVHYMGFPVADWIFSLCSIEQGFVIFNWRDILAICGLFMKPAMRSMKRSC